MRSANTTALIAGLVLVLVLGACAKSVPQSSTPVDRECGTAVLDVGDAIPDACTVTSFTDGKAITLVQARASKPMVLNFWASWCVYCIREMPDFQRAYERAAGRVSFLGLDLLGVQAETEAEAKALAAKTGAQYPLAYDKDGEFYHRVCPCGGRPLMPATVFVRADGTIAYLKFGPLNTKDLTELIQTHLKTEI
jgi:thiol-disulfide isomerase/thioredoxin